MRSIILALFSTAAFAQTTPYMGMTVPPIGDTNYATKINADLNLIDSHDHSPGKGAPISGANLVTNSITASQMANASIGTAQLALGSVTSQIIANGAVGTSQIANGAVGTSQIAVAGVTTQNLANNSVTNLILAPANITISSSSGTTAIGVTAFTDVSGLTGVTLTTFGRPIWVGLTPDSSSLTTGGLLFDGQITAITSAAELRIVETTGSTNLVDAVLPAGQQLPSFSCGVIYMPAAGTYVFKAQGRVGNASGSLNVYKTRLMAREL